MEKLVRDGNLLLFAMLREQGQLDPKSLEALKAKKIKLPSFSDEYDNWYSLAMRAVKQLLPDRYGDFMMQYRQDKKKELNVSTYGISEYLIGIARTLGQTTIVGREAAIPRMRTQVAILAAAQQSLDKRLIDIRDTIQADLFDSELDAAGGLANLGFVRGGGAIAGVVLEKHLDHVCNSHGIKSKKANPGINDLNQALKDGQLIDTPMWRLIQRLADLRNLCDHNKKVDPTKDDVAELVKGVQKVCKTVF